MKGIAVHDLLALLLGAALLWKAGVAGFSRDAAKASRALPALLLLLALLLALLRSELVALLPGAAAIAMWLHARRSTAAELPADTAASAGLHGLLPAAALFALLLRPLLMASWPLSKEPALRVALGALPGTQQLFVPAFGLSHYLVLALALVCLGIAMATMRRTSAAVATGVGLLGSGGAVAIAALFFHAASGDGLQPLGALLELLVVCPAFVCSLLLLRGELAAFPEGAERAARGLTALASGLSLALLLGAA